MAEESQTELERQLAGWRITPSDVRMAMKLLAASARRQSESLVDAGPVGTRVYDIHPLPTDATVQNLVERMASVDLQLKETSEKLDRVLAALGPKSPAA